MIRIATIAPIRLIPAMLLLVTIVAAGDLAAAPRVIVNLASGRQFEGDVSERSDNTRLWLSFRSSSAELLRPIAWSHIVSAELGEEQLTGLELRERLLSSPTAHFAQNESEQDGQEAPEIIPTPNALPNESMADEALDLLFSNARHAGDRVAAVQFDAQLANWDGDVEADGLIVHVIPVNHFGHVVPASGHVEVELHAQRRIAFHEGPHKRGRRVERIGRWVKQVTPHCVDATGCWFKLPFQADHPEFDPALGTSGIVHVKLVVPGDGVFESSIDGVRVRPFAPLRDDLQQVEGRRFLANERTTRGKRSH